MHHIENLLLETNAESRILYFESAKECMEAVLTKKVEMAILTDKVADYWLHKPIYNHQLTRVAGSGNYIYGMRLYVPKEHYHLITIINKTLDHISYTQKVYMLDNLSLSHSYAQQFEDVLYEHEETLFVITVLVAILRKDTVKNFFTNIHDGIPSGEMNVRIRLLDGQLRWYHFKYSFIFHQEKPVSAMISIHDITERHEQEMAYLRIKKLTESNIPGNKVSLEVNLTLDQVEKIEGIQAINYTEDKCYTVAKILNEISAQNIEFIQKEEAVKYFTTENFLAAYARGERDLHSEWQVCYPIGTEHWLDTEITLIEDPYNQNIKLFLRMRDITEEKIKQLEIRERSEKDGMTGIYNRKTAEDLIC